MSELDLKKESLSLLKNNGLFAHCSSEELNAIADKMQLKIFAPKEMIVKQDDVVDSVYFILSGEAEVNKPNVENPTDLLPIAHLSHGETIGLSPTGFFSQTGQRQANVVAINTVQAFCLLVKDIQELQ